MIFNVHAGHNPDGMIACGASGIVKESTEARAVVQAVIAKLRAGGHTAYDCTVNNGTSQNDVLKKIVNKCNVNPVDLDVSIHLNSGRNDYVGDGNIGGTEIYIYNDSSKAKPYAEKVLNEIVKLGFRNRNVKVSSSLYVLKHTKSPAMLIELFFVDDRDDTNLYQKLGVEGIANAIVKGLTGTAPSSSISTPVPQIFQAFKGVITSKNTNVRNSPSMNGSVIGKATEGQIVMVWGKDGEWYMVDTGKWIHSSLIRKE